MFWLICFVATWCALSLLFSGSRAFQNDPPWVIFLVAGLAAGMSVGIAFLAHHLVRAVFFYVVG